MHMMKILVVFMRKYEKSLSTIQLWTQLNKPFRYVHVLCVHHLLLKKPFLIGFTLKKSECRKVLNFSFFSIRTLLTSIIKHSRNSANLSTLS